MEVILQRQASVKRNLNDAPEKFRAKSVNTIQTLLESGVPCIIKLPKPQERWDGLDRLHNQREGRKIWENVLTCVGQEQFSSMGGFVFLANYDSPPMYWELRPGEKMFRPHQEEFHHRHSDKMYGIADFYYSETLQFSEIFNHIKELGYEFPKA